MKHGLIHLERVEWERHAAGFADHNYRQGWAYSFAAAHRVGATSEHVAIVADGAVRAIVDVRVRSLPLVGGGVAYINGGPLVRSTSEQIAQHTDRLHEAIRALHIEYVRRRGMVLRVLGTLGEPTWNAIQTSAWREAGFQPTTMAAAYRTIVVPLRDVSGAARSTSEIRAALAQKWRNCLNKAERQGIRVTTHRDVSAMSRFTSLYDEFVVRKGVHANHDAAFFLEVQREACAADDAAAERLTVRFAEREGNLLAGHVSSTLGDTTVYLLGATSPAGLTCNAAYLLQWDTMSQGCELGVTHYDLGGIDPDANPGVFHFKEGMRGLDLTAPGPFEATPRGLRGKVSVSSEKLYRSWRERAKPRDAKGIMPPVQARVHPSPASSD